MGSVVSVVIPTYNRSELTKRAIQSVVTTMPGRVEIVVIDDNGSTPFEFLSPRNNCGVAVRLIRLEKNIGPGMARAVGVQNASSNAIAFLDSDDEFDHNWLDILLLSISRMSSPANWPFLIAGTTVGARPVGQFVRNALAALPTPLQLVFARIIAVHFNPFYIQSMAMSKSLCSFKDDLRYCEDYYLTCVCLFGARSIWLPNAIACHLGRPPNSMGGESGSSHKMAQGEMEVRHALLSEAFVPPLYKLLVPIGMIYQFGRIAIKRLFAKRNRKSI